MRSSAAARIALTGALFLLPVLVMLLPADFRTGMGPWTPDQAGAAVLVLAPRAEYLGPLAGLLLFAGWAALAVLLSAEPPTAEAHTPAQEGDPTGRWRPLLPLTDVVGLR